jgi:prepilin-type N-terminal cleavage/methylation domain-containing protein
MENHTGESSLQPLNSMRNSLLTNSGFTMIELLMVMGIVGVLATMAYSTLGEIRDKTRNARCVSELRNIEKDIFSFASEKGSFPTSLAEIKRANEKDPWGNDYVYALAAEPVGPLNVGPLNRSSTGQTINSDFDLYSAGNNGLSTQSIIDPESTDDIIRANEGSFCDMAKRYGI